jgi:hypothetical protein
MDLVFTMTAGRTGTRFLARLIGDNAPEAEVHHERIGFGDFGVHAPDVSLLHGFNCQGLTAQVRGFWDAKFAAILAGEKPMYVETSHVLMKAGLVEQVAALAPQHTVHLVILQRNPLDVLSSYHRRGDFGGAANTWLWYLDPAYGNNRMRFSVPDGIHPLIAKRHWYLLEIAVRAEIYAAQLAGRPGIHVHRVGLESLNAPEGAAGFLRCLGIDVGPDTVRIGPAQNTSGGKGTSPPPVLRQIELCAQALQQTDCAGLAARFLAQAS